MYEKHNKANTIGGLYQDSDTTSKKKPKPKAYPVKDPDVRKPNVAAGSGTIKQVSDTAQVQRYHKDPNTGKIVPYNSERYTDDKKPSAPKKPKPEPRTPSRPRYSPKYSATFR